MQVGLNYTIATMDRMVFGNNGVILEVVFTVIADDSTVVTSVEVLVDSVFGSRPCGETQGKDRIVIDCVLRNSVYIRTATPDVHATPNNGIAFTGR